MATPPSPHPGMPRPSPPVRPSVRLALALALGGAAAAAQDRLVLFGTKDAGVTDKAIAEWGLDTAWPSHDNMRRGLVFMGADQVDLVRVTFPMNAPVVDGQLTTAQLDDIAYRVWLANLAGANKPLTLTADTGAGVDPWFKNGNQVIPSRWVETMAAAVRAYKARGKTFAAVSPFNEPDYGWDQGTVGNLYDILGLLRTHPDFTGVAFAGGSTLNNDAALTWYNPIKDRVSEGTTHQLAGGFDTYAAFYQTVRANGHKAVNEELHNVGEAIVGAEYGVQSGTWWASAERTRGAFVKANQGARLGYAEHRPNWTAAAVYRAPGGAVQAFVGSSERQAVTTSYRFVNRDRKVFYDGEGPKYAHTVTIPGGTGYQTGQTNAETMVNITWGADVPPPLNGRYLLVNRASGKVMEVAAAGTGDGANIRQNRPTGGTHQLWDVVPLDSRSGGDYAYHTLVAAHSGKAADLLNWSHDDGGNVLQWPAGGGANQHWFFEYVGNGWFHIRSRWSGKYLDVNGASTADGANILQWSGNGGLNQQWRPIPAGAPVEFVAPAAPTGLVAAANAVSVKLVWNASPATDLAGYTVLRAEAPAGPYDTIARGVVDTHYTDETALPGSAYYYGVRAEDRSLNRSGAAGPVSATPTGAPALVARFAFDSDLLDTSGNANHAAPGAGSGAADYASGRVGAGAIAFDGATRHLELPPGVAAHEQLSIATWVYWNGGGVWQRIFDFGNGTDQYLFLTPRADGAGLRFAIKNGGAEQQLNAPALATGQWVHVAVTLGAGDARLYVNGAQVAASTAITIRPGDFKPVLNYLGKSQWPDPLFDGRLDDFRIYNHALSDTDIAALVAGPLPAPVGVTLTPGPEQIRLAWPAVAGATGYTVRHATSPAGPYALLAEGLTEPSHTHAGLAYGQTYYYIVEAVNIAGAGASSSAAGATPESALLTEAERLAVRVELRATTTPEPATVATVTVPAAASVPGHVYQLHYTEDLANAAAWTAIGEPLLGDGTELVREFAPQAAAPRAFYRVLISR